MKKVFLVWICIAAILSSCTDDKVSDVKLNFKLNYDGAPLVMLQDYDYPDGRTIKFSRISFYMSDIEAIEGNTSTLLKDAVMINLGASHSSPELSQQGYTYNIENIPVEKLESLRFNIGLSPSLNAKTPADYEPGHPLAASGEYWIGWKSYIFAKIEGFIDLDNDGTAETTFALHLGSDPIKRTVSFSNPTVENGTASFDFDLDMKRVFSNGSTYDIVTTTNIHSLAQINQATFLIDNLVAALSMENN